MKALDHEIATISPGYKVFNGNIIDVNQTCSECSANVWC